MNDDDLLNMAVEIGYRLLENGGEIYRVEESIQRIFEAYGITTGEVFAIPSCIIVTITTPTGRPLSKLKRIHSVGTDLDKVERYNDLCRRICRERPLISSVLEQMRALEPGKVYPFWAQLLAYGAIAFSFTLFYGGGPADALCAIFCGAAIKISVAQMNRLRTNTFFLNIFASAAAALLAMAFVRLGLASQSDKIIIGSFMTLVPGVAITNVMRDIIAGDLIAGLTRLTESLLVATAIALGAGIAISAVRMIWGV